MIFTERQITVCEGKGKAIIDEPVILYRGDYEVSIKFTIMKSKFRFKSGVNLVDSEKASHGQLAILAPYGGNVFSEIVKCEDGTVTFTLTKEMIDQLEEVGLYSFQIRLFDYYRESRVSIPPVEFGIEVREPVASEDHDNEVNNAIVGYSIAKVVDGLNEDVPDTFDANGQYNKTDWETGDRITEGKLNKIEDALDKINQNEKKDVAALNKKADSNFNVLDSKIDFVANNGTTVDVIEKVTKEEIDRQIEDGTIANLTIENNSITTAKYKDGSITPLKTNFIKEYVNLADKNNINRGFYWSSHLDTVTESSGSNVATLPVIQLKAGCYYEMNRINSGFCWVIDDKTAIRTKLNEHDGYSAFKRGAQSLVGLMSPNDAKLYITVMTNLDYSNLMVVEGRLPYSYKEFNKPYNYEINGMPITGAYNEKIFIGPEKEFTNLQEFITSNLSVDYYGDEKHQTTIVLDDGEHYLSSEFDMPEFVNIISSSGNPNKCKVIYSPENATDSQVATYSLIKMQRCNNTLKGIHFIGKNCRYVVHPESTGLYKDTYINIEDCIFEHLTNTRGNWTSQFAWGEGSSSGNRLTAKNCTFIAHAPTSFAYSVHNNVNFEKPMLYTFNNCHFYAYGYGSCFRCEGMNSGTDDRVYLNNCELNGNVMLTNSLSIKVYAMGCSHVCSNTTDYFKPNSQVIYSEFTAMLKNNTAETIPAGTIVCYDNDNKNIRVMTDTDSSAILAGFTIGDTSPGEYAFVVKDGWYRYVDDFTFGKQYGVVDGKINADAANKIGMIAGGGFIRIKSNLN